MSSRLRCLAFLGLALLSAAAPPAQVLARPGWAGSGVAPEAWWLRAVIYRLDPARFQDSDGDGRGDLNGVIERLDYLQSLGIDALLLDSRSGDGDSNDLSELILQASRHHLRVLLTIDAPTAAGPREALLKSVRGWLSAGVAGFWLPEAPGPGLPASLLPALRGVLQSFPGERVLLTDAAAIARAAPLPASRSSRHSIDPGTFGAARGGVLVATASLPVSQDDTPRLRESLAAANSQPGPGLNPLLRLAHPPATGSLQAAVDAAILLGGRGAVLLDFGQELGLDCYPPALPGPQTAALPLMQWTPSNRTPAAAEPATPTTQPSAAPEFGAYHPYVRPPRDLAPPPSSTLRVRPDANIEPAPPAPDSLPGFTTAALPPAPLSDPQRSVITEDRDPNSLLNAYRQLIALHHGNATLRNGSLDLLNRDTGGALVWVRRAPAGSSTVANVVAAANLTAQPVTLALNADLDAQGIRPGALRLLFAFPRGQLGGEITGRLTLPPHAVLFGELSHSGASQQPTSRHRVRR